MDEDDEKQTKFHAIYWIIGILIVLCIIVAVVALIAFRKDGDNQIEALEPQIKEPCGNFLDGYEDELGINKKLLFDYASKFEHYANYESVDDRYGKSVQEILKPLTELKTSYLAVQQHLSEKLKAPEYKELLDDVTNCYAKNFQKVTNYEPPETIADLEKLLEY